MHKKEWFRGTNIELHEHRETDEVSLVFWDNPFTGKTFRMSRKNWIDLLVALKVVERAKVPTGFGLGDAPN